MLNSLIRKRAIMKRSGSHFLALYCYFPAYLSSFWMLCSLSVTYRVGKTVRHKTVPKTIYNLPHDEINVKMLFFLYNC